MNKKLVLFSVMLSVLPTVTCGFFSTLPLIGAAKRVVMPAARDAFGRFSNTAVDGAVIERFRDPATGKFVKKFAEKGFTLVGQPQPQETGFRLLGESFFPGPSALALTGQKALMVVKEAAHTTSAVIIPQVATTSLNISGVMAAHIVETLTAQEAKAISFIKRGIRLAQEAAAQAKTAGIRANTAQEVARLAQEGVIQRFKRLYATATAATLTGVAYVDSLIGSPAVTPLEGVAKQTAAIAVNSIAPVDSGIVPVSSPFLQGMVDGIAQHKLVAFGIATVAAGTAYCAYYKIHPLSKLKKAFKRS